MAIKAVILKGETVTLRPLSLNDAPRFVAWLRDPEVTNFLAIHDAPPPTLAEERDWIRVARRSRDTVNFAIDTVEGVNIGSCSLRRINEPNRRAELGIMIGNKRYWGQGCGTAACRLIVDYGFRRLKLHRIHLGLIAYNIRGEKAYRKVGFKIEGRARDYWYRNGHWHDRISMALLRDEYLKKINR